jgi:hypothetical protein
VERRYKAGVCDWVLESIVIMDVTGTMYDWAASVCDKPQMCDRNVCGLHVCIWLGRTRAEEAYFREPRTRDRIRRFLTLYCKQHDISE